MAEPDGLAMGLVSVTTELMRVLAERGFLDPEIVDYVDGVILASLDGMKADGRSAGYSMQVGPSMARLRAYAASTYMPIAPPHGEG